MRSYRIGLRLFLLLCVTASLLLGWLGIKSNLRQMEAELAGTSGSWERIGKYSGVVLGADGRPISADIHNGQDMDVLLANYDCSTVRTLGIYSSDAYRKFQPDIFPRVKRFHLANTELTAERLARLAALTDLESLTLTQGEDDNLSPEWTGLAEMAKLKYLILNVRPGVSFNEFPELKELRTVTLNSADRSARPWGTDLEQTTTLQQRLPHCTVISQPAKYTISGVGVK